MTTYKAILNTIVDEAGKQYAVVLPTNCTRTAAAQLAAWAAEALNKRLAELVKPEKGSKR